MRLERGQGESAVLSLRRAVDWRERAGREGKRVVFTNGCFDIIHRGHVELLREAASHGDLLIVGLNSDSSIRRLKGGGRPFVSQGDRAVIVSSFRYVDRVVIFEEETPLRLIRELRPDVLVKGGDYVLEEIVGRDIVEGDGGEVVVVPYLEGCSTSGLVDRIRESRAEG